jgi:prepilin-type processing-associated H-X9-DG protein
MASGTSNVVAVGERPPSYHPNASSNRYFGRWLMADYDTVLGNPNREAALAPTDLAGNPCPVPSYYRNDVLENPCAVTHFWSLHPGGANWLFADGSVRFLSYSTDTSAMNALSDVTGGTAGVGGGTILGN